MSSDQISSIPPDLSQIRSATPASPAHGPDWTYWANLTVVDYEDACILSLGYDPRAIKGNPLPQDLRAEVSRRKAIAASHLGSDLPAHLTSSNRYHESPATGVVLWEFRLWSESLSYPFSFVDGFPNEVPLARPAQPTRKEVEALSMELPDWAAVESLSLYEAGCLLGGIDPSPLRSIKATEPLSFIAEVQRTVRAPSAWVEKLTRAVKAKVVNASRVVVRGFGGPLDVRQIEPATVGPHEILVPELTTISSADLVTWCKEGAHPIPWPFRQAAVVPDVASLANYPEELRAAIEAFNAVSADPAATHKKSPKAALTKWLSENKGHLSTNARERIATVANWQPLGGAPKTLE